MQRSIMNELIEKAEALFSQGIVDRALGWKKGDTSYDVAPYSFESAAELRKGFVYNEFCASNLSKYIIEEVQKTKSKVLVFLKPCDTYSFNQLLTEHKFEREKVYVIAVPCNGTLSAASVKSYFGDDVVDAIADDNIVSADTLYHGVKTASMSDVILERCKCCKGKTPVAYDEIIGSCGDDTSSDRFEQVEYVERLSSEERYEFWKNELSRCIRCNACRDVCPACTCEKCVFDNPKSGVENKAASNIFEERMFHIIRAFHVAGRCTDCGECSRVCPQHIPLHLLNRKFIHDMDRFYGTYRAGETVGSRSPLVNYSKDDIEPEQVLRNRGEHDAKN